MYSTSVSSVHFNHPNGAQDTRGRTIEGLIRQVETAYANFEPRKIQTCMEEILKIHGANDFEVPHMGKDTMLRAGVLPTRVEATDRAIEVIQMVMERRPNNNNEDEDNNE